MSARPLNSVTPNAGPLNHGALAAAVRSGTPTLGTFIGTASPLAAEVCAAAGVDWVLLDLEHGAGGAQQRGRALHAGAAFESERGFLGHGAAATRDVAGVEIRREQRAEMLALDPLEFLAVRGPQRLDVRQLAPAGDGLVDHRCDQRLAPIA